MKPFRWPLAFLGAILLDVSFVRFFEFLHLETETVLVVFLLYVFYHLDYKKVSLVAVLLGALVGIFSIAPFSVFVLSYLAVGNASVYLLRNIAQAGKASFFIVGVTIFLAYQLIVQVFLGVVVFFGFSDIHPFLSPEFFLTIVLSALWNTFLLFLASTALALHKTNL